MLLVLICVVVLVRDAPEGSEETSIILAHPASNRHQRKSSLEPAILIATVGAVSDDFCNSLSRQISEMKVRMMNYESCDDLSIYAPR